jgi:hypothetical protein
MFPTQARSAPVGVEHYQEFAINVVYTFTSIVSAPVEMVLRPQYGSEYFSPVVTFFAGVMMVMLPVISLFADGVSHMIPFVRIPAPVGVFGIGTLSRLYFLGGFIHGFRIWRRMIHPERELHSQWAGPPLPFFYILPWSSWWVIRIIYEPVFVFALSMVLTNFFILQGSAAHYLMFAAVMLAMKNYVEWYMQWRYLRQIMNSRAVAPIIAKVADNTATEDERAMVHMASLPKDIPEDLRRDTLAHVARTLGGERHEG